MKIKKTFQGSLPENRIFNTDSSSQTDTYSCDYINDSSVVVSASEPKENRKKIWMQKGKNLFDKNNVNMLSAATSGDTGKIVTNNNMRLIYISCKPNTIYTSQKIQGQNNNLSYTKELPQIGTEFYGRVLNQTGTTCTITTGADAKYLVLVILNTEAESSLTLQQVLNSIQIEQGSAATSYEPYVDNKIYIKNNNDVYEEFMKKEEITYSTSEQKIGTWIDGKPLYRKVYDNITINSSETIIASTSGINIKMIYGWLVGASNGTVQPLGSYASMDTTHTSRVFCDNTYIKVQANSTYNTGTYKARVIVEYTKTTD